MTNFGFPVIVLSTLLSVLLLCPVIAKEAINQSKNDSNLELADPPYTKEEIKKCIEAYRYLLELKISSLSKKYAHSSSSSSTIKNAEIKAEELLTKLRSVLPGNKVVSSSHTVSADILALEDRLKRYRQSQKGVVDRYYLKDELSKLIGSRLKYHSRSNVPSGSTRLWVDPRQTVDQRVRIFLKKNSN